MNEIVSWWFGQHYIWSTLLTPGPSFIWACYYGETWRAVVAGVLALLAGVGRYNTATK